MKNLKKNAPNNNKIENHTNTKSNRALAISCICSVTFMILMTVGSMIYFKAQLAKSADAMKGMETEEYERHYVLITDEQNSSFWQSVYEGAKEEGEKNGTYVELLGSNLSTDYEQKQLMRIAIEAKVDGIILAANESGAVTALINEAVAEKIPVVTVLNDNTSNRQSFVGIGSYNLGKDYGRQVCQIVEEKPENSYKNGTCKVLILMDGEFQNTNDMLVLGGIQETIEQEYKGSVSIKCDSEYISQKGNFAAEEAIRDIFMKFQLPDIIICLNELNTTCVYQAMVDYNKVGDIDIIGYYNSASILKAIERDVIYSTLTIDTKQMGRYCVDALDEYIEMGYVSDYIPVDTYLINSENVAEYLGGIEENVEE